MKGFRDFVLRGNVVDLAVAVVIGTAFTAIVTAIVTNLIDASSLNGALIVHLPTLSGKPSDLRFGAVLGAIINFVIIAAVVYFAFVVPINYAMKKAFARRKQEESATPVETPPTETELLIQIRDLLAGTPSPEGDHTLPAGGGSHRA